MFFFISPPKFFRAAWRRTEVKKWRRLMKNEKCLSKLREQIRSGKSSVIMSVTQADVGQAVPKSVRTREDWYFPLRSEEKKKKRSSHLEKPTGSERDQSESPVPGRDPIGLDRKKKGRVRDFRKPEESYPLSAYFCMSGKRTGPAAGAGRRRRQQATAKRLSFFIRENPS